MRSDAIQKQQFEIEYFFLLSKLLSKSIKHMIRRALKPKQKKKIIYFIRTQYNCAIERGINRGKNSIFFFLFKFCPHQQRMYRVCSIRTTSIRKSVRPHNRTCHEVSMDASALICQFTNVVCVAMTAPMDRERGADKLQSRSEIQQQLQPAQNHTRKISKNISVRLTQDESH